MRFLKFVSGSQPNANKTQVVPILHFVFLSKFDIFGILFKGYVIFFSRFVGLIVLLKISVRCT